MANGISYDRHVEEHAVDVFADAVLEAGSTYMHNPARRQIPDWLRVLSAKPDMTRMLRATTRGFERASEEALELTREKA